MVRNVNEQVAQFRGHMETVWPTPTLADTIRYVYQELGEADSAAMKCGYQDKEYSRSHPAVSSRLVELENLTIECGHVLIMFITYLNHLGISFDTALQAGMEDILLKQIDKHSSFYPSYAADLLEEFRGGGDVES